LREHHHGVAADLLDLAVGLVARDLQDVVSQDVEVGDGVVAVAEAEGEDVVAGVAGQGVGPGAAVVPTPPACRRQVIAPE